MKKKFLNIFSMPVKRRQGRIIRSEALVRESPKIFLAIKLGNNKTIPATTIKSRKNVLIAIDTTR